MKTTSVILSLIFCLGFQSPFCLAEEAHYIISHFDINNNDAVSFDEFYIVMIRKKGNAIYDTFSVGDLNQNGVISASEAVIFNVTKQEFHHVDKDGDGEVTFQEFSSVMLHDMFEKFDLNHDQLLKEAEFDAVLD